MTLEERVPAAPVRALLTLAAPALVALLMLFIALGWYGSEASRRDQASAVRAALQATEQRLAGRKLDLNPDRMLIGGATAGVAQSQLQAKILELAGREGVGADQLETRPAPDAETLPGLSALSMGVEIRGAQPQVMEFLIALETGEPLLFVDRIDIAAAEPDASAGPDAPVQITARVIITGWRKGELAP